MNSIAAYCMADLFERLHRKNLTTHLGRTSSTSWAALPPLLQGAAVLAGDLADPVLDVPAQDSWI